MNKTKAHFSVQGHNLTGVYETRDEILLQTRVYAVHKINIKYIPACNRKKTERIIVWYELLHTVPQNFKLRPMR